jgi:hypothetical protein
MDLDGLREVLKQERTDLLQKIINAKIFRPEQIRYLAELHTAIEAVSTQIAQGPRLRAQ